METGDTNLYPSGLFVEDIQCIMLTGRFTGINFLRISRISLTCHSSLPLGPIWYDYPTTGFRRL